MLRYAVIVVTYHPDIKTIDNLKQISNTCDLLIIVDNTPSPLKSNFPLESHVIIIYNNTNIGLASALNKGMDIAFTNGIENVFLLDQDSHPSKNYFQQMLDFKSRLSNTSAKYAFYVPNFYDRNSKTFATFPVVSRFSIRHKKCGKTPLIIKHGALIAITSGMLIAKEAFNVIGPLREDYFIDFIDNEYCLRAHTLGYSIGLNCNLMLDHAIGNRRVKKLYGITFKPNNHSPIRKYYIFRNGIRTTIEYFSQYPAYALLIIARLFHDFLCIIIYEKEAYAKIRALILGIWHGFLGRMGKFG